MPARKYTCLLLLTFPAFAFGQGSNDPAALWNQATLYRDAWGVPHIYADNLRAMAFAFGYAQAEDHLERMLVAYRAANGRTAEVFGEAYAAADELAIRMGHRDLARQAYANADFATRDLCEGFALGVNHWLVQHYDQAPPWAEGVQPPDVLAFMHYYLMSQAPFDFERMSRRPRGTPSGNAWAVGPSQSATGEAMLVINPHTDYHDVFQWYEAHLVVGDMNMTGATLYGLPVILQGHNAHLGWALTPNDADFADVYVESPRKFEREPNSVGPAQALTRTAFFLKTVAESKPYYVRTAQGMVERRTPQQASARGPIIAQWAGRPLAYRVGGYGEFGALRQLLAMASAETLTAFQSALTMHQLPCFHVVYADQEGNVFYLYNAKVGQKASFPTPVQASPLLERPKSPWDGPVSSIDTSFQWGEIIPPAYLPFQLNPESGFVQACGTPPWRASGDVPDWPIEGLRWLVRDTDSYRAARVRQLLSQGARNFEDMQSMVFDELVPFAVDAVPHLLSLVEDTPGFLESAHPDVPAALDMLRDWDHLASTDSTAMTLFHVWWTTFRENCPFPVETDEDCYRVLADDLPVAKEYALRSFAEAVKRMRNVFQTINVTWGEVHRLYRGSEDIPASGAGTGEPVLVSGAREFRKGKWPVTYGYGYAMAVRFGSTPASMSVVPFGASDNPESPHFADQLELFTEGRMKPVAFTRNAVERASEEAWGRGMTFRPVDGLAVVRVRAAAPVHAAISVDDDERGAPPSISAFSRLIEPRLKPDNVPAEILFEFTIPEELCGRNNLEYLAVHGYSPDHGWRRVPEQRLDWDRRTFVARGTAGMPIAVLGPSRLRRGPLMLASTPRAAPPSPPRPIVPAPKGYTPLHERPREMEGDESPVAPDVTEESPAQDTVLDTPAAEAAPSPMTPARPAPERQSSPPAVDSPREGPVEPREDAESQPAERATPEPSPPRADPPETERASSGTAPADNVWTTAKIREHDASDEADATGGEKQRGFQWSSESLSALRGPRHKRRHSLFLVPEDALASPMVIGTNLSLRPPVPGALFHVTTSKTVRAQVQVHDTPPAPLPEGLAAFTHIFSIEYDPQRVQGRVGVSVQVQPGVCRGADFGKLELYTYDSEHGWQPLQGHKRDAASRSLTGLDFRVRTYGVLGPASALQRPPSG